MGNYNRLEAVKYAQKWALGANPKFYHFEGIGGDCTNFISQCLLAGGGAMVYNKANGWYYISSENRSPSWTSVESLASFLLRQTDKGIVGRKSDLSSLREGDLIQLRQNPYRFNHSLIISRISNGQIYVCAHSFDALDRKFSSYSYLEAVGLKIEIL